MEVAAGVQEVDRHAVSLLANLNVQRQQAQYCDCVVIQSLNPGQLYPAHRCVLSASSPVLKSILSSSGVLVELQDPCLSDPVLAIILDYIYTGLLPYIQRKHYTNLLSASHYLQMNELQEILKAAQPTEVYTAGSRNTSSEESSNSEIKTVNCFTEHTVSSQACCGSSLQRDNHQDLADEAACNERDCCQETPQVVVQNWPCTEAHVESKEGNEILKDLCHSAGAMAQETWPESIEHKVVKIVEDRRSSNKCCRAEVQEGWTTEVKETQKHFLGVESTAEEEQNRKQEDDIQIHPCLPHIPTSAVNDVCPSQIASSCSSFSSTRPCGEAVPVIRHSSSALIPQLTQMAKAQTSPVPSYKSVSEAPGSSSTLCEPTDHDSIVKLITINDQFNCPPQNHGFNNENEDLHDNSEQQNRFCSSFTRGIKFKRDLRFLDVPSRNHQLDCSDCHSNIMATAVKKSPVYSHDLREAIPPPVQDKDTESDCHCEHSRPMGELKEEQNYSSRFSPEEEGLESHCNLYKPKADWYLNLQRAETTPDNDSDSKNTSMAEKRRCLSTTRTPELGCGDDTGSYLALDQQEPMDLENLTSQKPADINTSDDMSGIIKHSYRGQIYYHCLPQNESDNKHPYPGYPDLTGQCSEEEDEGTSASQGSSPLRQRFAKGTAEQVLLLDISSKPAELLVSYKKRSNRTEDWITYDQRGSFESGLMSLDSEQWDKDRPVTEEEERLTTANGFVDADSQSLFGEASIAEGKPFGITRNSPRAEALHGAKTVEDGNQTTTVTACSHPSVPELVKGPESSAFSVCAPSSLSGSVSAHKSAHLSTSVHRAFQCYLCDRPFSQRGSLNRHVRSHLGVRPFPCPRCPMTFSRQYRVTEHMRVHQRFSVETDLQQSPS